MAVTLDLPCWSIADVWCKGVWCKGQEGCSRAAHGQLRKPTISIVLKFTSAFRGLISCGTMQPEWSVRHLG